MEVCGVFIILMGIKSYRESTYKGAEKVYKKVVELKCTHIISSASWEELVKNKSVTCNACGSIALQLAGCLPKGVRVGHVSTKGKKESSITSIDKAMYNANRLSNCRLIWCNCKYGELPVWLRERGTVYIQWSNCCVNAGNGYIWSCNQGEGYHGGRYTEYLNGVLSKRAIRLAARFSLRSCLMINGISTMRSSVYWDCMETAKTGKNFLAKIIRKSSLSLTICSKTRTTYIGGLPTIFWKCMPEMVRRERNFWKVL